MTPPGWFQILKGAPTFTPKGCFYVVNLECPQILAPSTLPIRVPYIRRRWTLVAFRRSSWPLARRAISGRGGCSRESAMQSFHQRPLQEPLTEDSSSIKGSRKMDSAMCISKCAEPPQRMVCQHLEKTRHPENTNHHLEKTNHHPGNTNHPEALTWFVLRIASQAQSPRRILLRMVVPPTPTWTSSTGLLNPR